MDLETRYKKAVADIEAKGVRVFENYPACCGSCASYELGTNEDLKDKEYIYFIDDQGHGLEWDKGKPFNFEIFLEEEIDEPNGIYEEKETREVFPATHIYWNHSGTRAGEVTTEAFRSNGFKVDWDGSDMKCPEILLVDEENAA